MKKKLPARKLFFEAMAFRKAYSLVYRSHSQSRCTCRMLIAGVDEAGRGCVIGPLVVAGVVMKAENLPLLTKLGVKDSKLLTPKKRDTLYPEIIRLTEKFQTIQVPPCEIDKAVASARKLHKLNRLEALTMARVIEDLMPDEAYVDAADTLEYRFRNHIKECLKIKTRIISKHKADRIYPVVSAASIIAKVERDREIANLKLSYGDFGSGYLTDKKTACFLKQLLKNNDEYPSFVRKSWKPARRMKDEKGTLQTKLV
jgi:ribonuclease HII